MCAAVKCLFRDRRPRELDNTLRSKQIFLQIKLKLIFFHPILYFTLVLPVQQQAATNSSSSEDEAQRSAGSVVRRRRVRKNTASVTDPEEEEENGEAVPESRSSEEEEDEVKEKELQEAQTQGTATATLDDGVQGRDSSILTKYILLVLIIAIIMGFGHFYGKKFTPESQHFIHFKSHC